MVGDKINNSGKIGYIDLPKMKNIGIPFEKELPKFEEELANVLNDMIVSILNEDTRNKKLYMKDKTWMGLCYRLENFIECNRVLCDVI